MERTIDVVSTMQFIHIWYTKHEDNEKNESEEQPRISSLV